MDQTGNKKKAPTSGRARGLAADKLKQVVEHVMKEIHADQGPHRMHVYTTRQILLIQQRYQKDARDPDAGHLQVVKWAAGQLSSDVHRFLEARDWKIAAVEDSQDYYQHTKQYLDDYEKTMKARLENSLASCDLHRKTLVITARHHQWGMDGSRIYDKQEVLHTIEHEASHALDWVLGGDAYLSSRPNFQQAFAEDLKNLDEQQLQELGFKQLMLNSSREVFANLGATSSTWWYDSPTLERAFPRMTKLMKDAFAAQKIELPPDESWHSGFFKQSTGMFFQRFLTLFRW